MSLSSGNCESAKEENSEKKENNINV